MALLQVGLTLPPVILFQWKMARGNVLVLANYHILFTGCHDSWKENKKMILEKEKKHTWE